MATGINNSKQEFGLSSKNRERAKNSLVCTISLLLSDRTGYHFARSSKAWVNRIGHCAPKCTELHKGRALQARHPDIVSQRTVNPGSADDPDSLIPCSSPANRVISRTTAVSGPIADPAGG